MEAINQSTSYGAGQNIHEAAQNVDKTTSFNIFEAVEYFCRRFLQDDGSDEMIALFLHPQGAVCPYCRKHIESPRAIKSFYNLKRCVCKSCGKWFAATTGTLLQGCHNPRAVFFVAVFTALKADIKQIAKLLNMHPASVQQWQKKFQAVEGVNE